MSQVFLQIYSIFVLCIFIQENYGSSQENETTESEHLPDQNSWTYWIKYLQNRIETNENCEFKFCSCADLLKLDGVFCRGISQYYISELVFFSYNVTYIPSKILPGYHLQKLYVYGPFIAVDENILEQIISLTTFYVEISNIQIVPDFRFVKDSIKNITIEKSHLSSLGGRNLQNLTLLTYLSFSKNAIQSIDPDVFEGTEKIEELNLSYNLLTSIPPKLLDSMKNLFNFTASYNNLLHVDGLFSNTLPKHIMLQFNNITNANTILHFDVMEKRRQLDARYGLEVEIEVLDLSYNFLKASSATTVFSCYMNPYHRAPPFRIEVLLLKGNKLENLNTCFKYTMVAKMNVAKNEIQYLTASNFVPFGHTGDFTYGENQIRRIDADAFIHNKRYLNYLKLSVNKITSINGSVRYLSELRWLDVSHNSIQSLAEDEFTGLYELYYLSLHHNQITSLGLLQQLINLDELRINDNKIKLIKPEHVPKHLRRIDFANNPFTCDCAFQHFIDRVKANRNREFDTEYCLSSKTEYEAQKSENCPLNCSCSCTDNGDIPFMFMDCRSRNSAVAPQFFRSNLMLSGNDTERITSNEQGDFVIDQNINPSLHIEDRVYGINLENNNLEFLDEAQLPPNLSHLYLSDNKLKRLPESLLDNQLNLKQVSLSGNPWKCDCSSIKFKKWLTSKNTIILDINNIRCGTTDKGKEELNGKVIWILTDLDLCPPSDKRLVITLSFSILSFIILCLTAKVLYTRYELHVKVFLYYHGFSFVKEEDINYNKEFDAFISFSHEDDEFVIKDMISEIENNDPNIRLCLHYRHFMAGEFIQDNITKAVKSSKKTVIILSKNFLKSDWCLLEFRTAHAQVMEDKVHRIIVVKLEDLPQEINPIIKVYMDSTTYLTWGEYNFWKKLLFILSSTSCIRNPVPRVIGDIDNEMLVNSSLYDV